MVSCQYCSTLNSLDSAFCKQCGKLLPAEVVHDAREQLHQRVNHGYELFEQGHTDEAAMIAETSLATDPSMVRALSLRAMVLERRGMFAEALDAYEAVLARDPNSALDQIKANQIRGLLASRTTAAPVDRRMAAMVAAGAAVLVITISALAAALNSRPTPTANLVASNAEPKPQYSLTPFQPAPRESLAAQQGGAQTPQQAPQQQTAAPVQPEGAATPPLTGNMAPNSVLPRPGPAGAQPSGENTPVNPLPTGFELRPMAEAKQPSQGPRLPDPEPRTEVASQPEPEEDPGFYDIRVSEPEQQKAAGGIDRNGLEALVRTARSQYQVGNYQAAASTYERAIAAGADPATNLQRLAQCYEKLGRQSEAIDAYNRAISSIEGRMSSGRADDRLRAALDSSRQALKNLQGG